MDKNLTSKDNHGFVFIVSIVLFALLTLPLVPIWTACLRVILFAICVSHIAQNKSQISHHKNTLLIAVAIPLIAIIMGDVYSAMSSSSPASYIVKSVKNIYGHPFGVEAAFSVYLIDIFLISLTARFLWSESNKQRRYLLTFLLLFYFFSQGRLFFDFFNFLFNFGDGEVSLKSLAVQLNGLSSWGIWIAGFLATFLIANNGNRVKVILYACLGAGVLQALIVDLQWLLSDFSYVLESEDFSKYFYRVRGTYFYHASSSQTLMLLFFVSLSLYAYGDSKGLILLQLLMVSALYLNATRSISLTMIIGSVPFLLSMLLMRKKSKEVIALLVLVIMLFTSEVFVIKPVNYVTDVPAPQQVAESVHKSPNVTKSIYATIAKEGTTSKQKTVTEQAIASQQSNQNALNAIVVDPWVGSPAPTIDEIAPEDEVASAPVDMVTANQSRSLLLLNGLPLFIETFLIGQGVGTAKIPLFGTAFGGIENTYSTHALLPDIFIMGGGLAAIMLVIFVCLILKLAIQKIIKEPSSPTAWILCSFISGIIAYLASSFFFPQERNLIILFVFSLLGLTASIVETKDPLEKEPGMKSSLFFKTSITGISTGALLWALATSPSFAFPAVEFCFKHHQGEAVYTNSPRIKFLVKNLCRFDDGVDSAFLLKDDIDSLANIDDSWVLWSSINDPNYPNLRKGLKYNHHRGWERMPSMTLPRNWMVVKNVQPTVSFVKVGAQKKTFNAADAGLLKWHQVSRDDAWNPKYLQTSIDKNTLKNDGFYIMNFTPHLKSGIPLSGFLLEIPHIEAKKLIVDVEYELVFNTGEILRGKENARTYGNDIATIDVDFPNNKVSSIRLILPGNAAAHASLQLVSDFYPQQRVSSNVSSVYKLFDHNHGSYFQVAEFNDSRGVLVDLGPDSKRPVKLYRISGVENIHPGGSPRQWKVFGSKDGKSWSLIDSREAVNLASGLRQFSEFYIKSTEINRYYKFEFYQPDKSGPKWISELEIYLQ